MNSMHKEILWTSGFFNERFPAPVSPLGWSHIGSLIEATALREPLRYLGYPEAETISLVRLWRGHPYVNALAFQMFYKLFPDFFLPDDAYRYFPDGDTLLRHRIPYPRSIFDPRFLFAFTRAFLRDWQNFSTLHNHRVWTRYTQVHDERVAALRARLPALRDAESTEIFSALREMQNAHRDLLRIHRWSLMHADLTFGLLRRLVGNERAAHAVADVPNKTLQVNAAMKNLPMEKFLEEHGHRSFSLDIAVPTFAESPEQVSQLAQGANKKIETQEPRESFSGINTWVLGLARIYVGLREDQRYYWQKSLAVARQLYLILADRLIAAGVIGERATIFYATSSELEEFFNHQVTQDEFSHLIAARQIEWREYEREFAQSPTMTYPAFLLGDVPLVSRARENVRTEWRGRAVSPGIARGAARIVRSPEELARVQSGDILIAPATDPAWTPVFARIAGLIVERGGVLSHSAVVAREYHVPAVAGIPGIVDEMRDGQMLQVDGSTGEIRLV
jgi:phosphohistidine swiveling domain-containing protein